MWEGIVQKFLHRYLSPYIYGLRKDKVTFGLMSGDLKITEFFVKPEVSDLLDLPFDVDYGRVDLLQLNMPWGGMLLGGSKSVTLVASGITLFLSPKVLDAGGSTNEEDLMRIVERLRSQKLKHVIHQENASVDIWRTEQMALNASQQGNGQAQSQQVGFGTFLLNKMIRSLTIDIRDIKVCLRDPNRQLLIGSAIKSIQIFNTDKHGSVTSGDVGPTGIQYKAINTTGIGVFYGQCQWLNSTVVVPREMSTTSIIENQATTESGLEIKNAGDAELNLKEGTLEQIQTNNAYGEIIRRIEDVISTANRMTQDKHKNVDTNAVSAPPFTITVGVDPLKKRFVAAQNVCMEVELRNFAYVLHPTDILLGLKIDKAGKSMQAKLKIDESTKGITIERSQLKSVLDISRESQLRQKNYHRLLTAEASLVDLSNEALEEGGVTKHEYWNLYSKQLMVQEGYLPPNSFPMSDQLRLQILNDVIPSRLLIKWRSRCRITLEKRRVGKQQTQQPVQQPGWWSRLTGSNSQDMGKSDPQKRELSESTQNTEDLLLDPQEVKYLQSELQALDDLEMSATNMEFSVELQKFSVELLDSAIESQYPFMQLLLSGVSFGLLLEPKIDHELRDVYQWSFTSKLEALQCNQWGIPWMCLEEAAGRKSSFQDAFEDAISEESRDLRKTLSSDLDGSSYIYVSNTVKSTHHLLNVRVKVLPLILFVKPKLFIDILNFFTFKASTEFEEEMRKVGGAVQAAQNNALFNDLLADQTEKIRARVADNQTVNTQEASKKRFRWDIDLAAPIIIYEDVAKDQLRRRRLKTHLGRLTIMTPEERTLHDLKFDCDLTDIQLIYSLELNNPGEQPFEKQIIAPINLGLQISLEKLKKIDVLWTTETVAVHVTPEFVDMLSNLIETVQNISDGDDGNDVASATTMVDDDDFKRLLLQTSSDILDRTNEPSGDTPVTPLLEEEGEETRRPELSMLTMSFTNRRFEFVLEDAAGGERLISKFAEMNAYYKRNWITNEMLTTFTCGSLLVADGIADLVLARTSDKANTTLKIWDRGSPGSTDMELDFSKKARLYGQPVTVQRYIEIRSATSYADWHPQSISEIISLLRCYSDILDTSPTGEPTEELPSPDIQDSLPAFTDRTDEDSEIVEALKVGHIPEVELIDSIPPLLVHCSIAGLKINFWDGNLLANSVALTRMEMTMFHTESTQEEVDMELKMSQMSCWSHGRCVFSTLKDAESRPSIVLTYRKYKLKSYSGACLVEIAPVEYCFVNQDLIKFVKYLSGSVLETLVKKSYEVAKNIVQQREFFWRVVMTKPHLMLPEDKAIIPQVWKKYNLLPGTMEFFMSAKSGYRSAFTQSCLPLKYSAGTSTDALESFNDVLYAPCDKHYLGVYINASLDQISFRNLSPTKFGVGLNQFSLVAHGEHGFIETPHEDINGTLIDPFDIYLVVDLQPSTLIAAPPILVDCAATPIRGRLTRKQLAAVLDVLNENISGGGYSPQPVDASEDLTNSIQQSPTKFSVRLKVSEISLQTLFNEQRPLANLQVENIHLAADVALYSAFNIYGFALLSRGVKIIDSRNGSATTSKVFCETEDLTRKVYSEVDESEVNLGVKYGATLLGNGSGESCASKQPEESAIDYMGDGECHCYDRVQSLTQILGWIPAEAFEFSWYRDLPFSLIDQCSFRIFFTSNMARSHLEISALYGQLQFLGILGLDIFEWITSALAFSSLRIFPKPVVAVVKNGRQADSNEQGINQGRVVLPENIPFMFDLLLHHASVILPQAPDTAGNLPSVRWTTDLIVRGISDVQGVSFQDLKLVNGRISLNDHRLICDNIKLLGGGGYRALFDPVFQALPTEPRNKRIEALSPELYKFLSLPITHHIAVAEGYFTFKIPQLQSYVRASDIPVLAAASTALFKDFPSASTGETPPSITPPVYIAGAGADTYCHPAEQSIFRFFNLEFVFPSLVINLIETRSQESITVPVFSAHFDDSSLFISWSPQCLLIDLQQCSLNIQHYNLNAGDWEPFIESCVVHCSARRSRPLDRVLKFMREQLALRNVSLAEEDEVELSENRAPSESDEQIPTTVYPANDSIMSLQYLSYLKRDTTYQNLCEHPWEIGNMKSRKRALSQQRIAFSKPLLVNITPRILQDSLWISNKLQSLSDDRPMTDQDGSIGTSSLTCVNTSGINFLLLRVQIRKENASNQDRNRRVYHTSSKRGQVLDILDDDDKSSSTTSPTINRAWYRSLELKCGTSNLEEFVSADLYPSDSISNCQISNPYLDLPPQAILCCLTPDDETVERLRQMLLAQFDHASVEITTGAVKRCLSKLLDVNQVINRFKNEYLLKSGAAEASEPSNLSSSATPLVRPPTGPITLDPVPALFNEDLGVGVEMAMLNLQKANGAELISPARISQRSKVLAEVARKKAVGKRQEQVVQLLAQTMSPKPATQVLLVSSPVIIENSSHIYLEVVFLDATDKHTLSMDGPFDRYRCPLSLLADRRERRSLPDSTDPIMKFTSLTATNPALLEDYSLLTSRMDSLDYSYSIVIPPDTMLSVPLSAFTAGGRVTFVFRPLGYTVADLHSPPFNNNLKELISSYGRGSLTQRGFTSLVDTVDDFVPSRDVYNYRVSQKYRPKPDSTPRTQPSKHPTGQITVTVEGPPTYFDLSFFTKSTPLPAKSSIQNIVIMPALMCLNAAPVQLSMMLKGGGGKSQAAKKNANLRSDVGTVVSPPLEPGEVFVVFDIPPPTTHGPVELALQFLQPEKTAWSTSTHIAVPDQRLMFNSNEDVEQVDEEETLIHKLLITGRNGYGDAILEMRREVTDVMAFLPDLVHPRQQVCVISAPVWIVNRTGIDLQFMSDNGKKLWPTSPKMKGMFLADDITRLKLVCFTENPGHTPSARIPIPIESSVATVQLTDNEEAVFAMKSEKIHLEETAGALSRLLILNCKYLITNMCPWPLKLTNVRPTKANDSNVPTLLIAAGATAPLRTIFKDKIPTLFFKPQPPELQYRWSNEIHPMERWAGDTHLTLPIDGPDGPTVGVFCVRIIAHDSITNVVISEMASANNASSGVIVRNLFPKESAVSVCLRPFHTEMINAKALGLKDVAPRPNASEAIATVRVIEPEESSLIAWSRPFVHRSRGVAVVLRIADETLFPKTPNIFTVTTDGQHTNKCFNIHVLGPEMGPRAREVMKKWKGPLESDHRLACEAVLRTEKHGDCIEITVSPEFVHNPSRSLSAGIYDPLLKQLVINETDLEQIWDLQVCRMGLSLISEKLQQELVFAELSHISAHSSLKNDSQKCMLWITGVQIDQQASTNRKDKTSYVMLGNRGRTLQPNTAAGQMAAPGQVSNPFLCLEFVRPTVQSQEISFEHFNISLDDLELDVDTEMILLLQFYYQECLKSHGFTLSAQGLHLNHVLKNYVGVPTHQDYYKAVRRRTPTRKYGMTRPFIDSRTESWKKKLPPRKLSQEIEERRRNSDGSIDGQPSIPSSLDGGRMDEDAPIRISRSQSLGDTVGGTIEFEPRNLDNIPLCMSLDRINIDQFTLYTWCSFIIDKLEFIGPFAVLLKLISKRFDLKGAPIKFQSHAVNEPMRGNFRTILKNIQDTYTSQVFNSIAILVGYSSLLDIPMIPVELLRTGVDAGLHTFNTVTNTFGTFLSNFTMDKDYINDRQRERSQNQATSLTGGLQAAARNFGEGVLSIGNIITKPAEGFRRDGAQGFVKNIIPGIMGTVVKPVDKLGQALNNVVSGVRAEYVEKTPGEGKQILQRRRKPRMLWGDQGRLREYRPWEANIREALISSSNERRDLVKGLVECYHLTTMNNAVLWLAFYPNKIVLIQRAKVWECEIAQIDQMITTTHGLIVYTNATTYQIPTTDPILLHKLYLLIRSLRSSLNNLVVLTPKGLKIIRR